MTISHMSKWNADLPAIEGRISREICAI